MGLSIFFALLYSVTNFQVLALQVAPTWTTSTLVQAGEKNVIATKSNKNTIPIPSATMTFAFAFSSVPHLAYGMPAYEGNIYLIKGMMGSVKNILKSIVLA